MGIDSYERRMRALLPVVPYAAGQQVSIPMVHMHTLHRPATERCPCVCIGTGTGGRAARSVCMLMTSECYRKRSAQTGWRGYNACIALEGIMQNTKRLCYHRCSR